VTSGKRLYEGEKDERASPEESGWLAYEFNWSKRGAWTALKLDVTYVEFLNWLGDGTYPEVAMAIRDAVEAYKAANGHLLRRHKVTFVPHAEAVANMAAVLGDPDDKGE